MTSSDQFHPERPAHDPLSEEMDLLTWQEAAARLYDEAEVAEAEIAGLEALGDQLSDAQREDLAANRTRLGALQRVAARLAAQRPGEAGDRAPSSGWN